ncbi:hypothetical protein SPHINGOT1_10156 [Sphingomonas sp. T1]|nr:hypothetical protein SPHINGOT1_10156 [Sphingomonas sp. T1]
MRAVAAAYDKSNVKTLVAEHGRTTDGTRRHHAGAGVPAGPDRARYQRACSDGARCGERRPDRSDQPDRGAVDQSLVAA